MAGVTCPEKEIPLKHGGKIIVNGDFKPLCLKDMCVKYETCPHKDTKRP